MGEEEIETPFKAGDTEEYSRMNFLLFGGIGPRFFPLSVSLVPLKWKYFQEDLEMTMIAGFTSATQDPATADIHAEVVWGIAYSSSLPAAFAPISPNEEL